MSMSATREPLFGMVFASRRRSRPPQPWGKKASAQDVASVNPFFSGMLIGICITVALVFLTSSIDIRLSNAEQEYYILDEPQ